MMSSQTSSTAQIGGLPPPPGVTPNFVNPENHTAQGHAVFIMCLVLSTIFVVLRTYTRFILLKSHGWEDCECLPTLWRLLRVDMLANRSQMRA